MSKYVRLDDVQNTIMRMTNDARGADIVREVGKIPAADVQKVKYAKWKIDRFSNTWCSECHHSSGVDATDYCPNCGAKMDLGKEMTKHKALKFRVGDRIRYCYEDSDNYDRIGLVVDVSKMGTQFPYYVSLDSTDTQPNIIFWTSEDVLEPFQGEDKVMKICFGGCNCPIYDTDGNEMKFKIGDRVKASCGRDYELSGIVIGIDGNDGVSIPYLVSFKGFTEGHNGTQSWLTEGHAMPDDDHSCYWCAEDELQLDKRSFDVHIGDYIQIRQWDDMEKEFGYAAGAIHCDHHFVDSMSYMCGKVYKVTDVDINRNGAKMYHVEHETWDISDDIIECVITTDIKVFKPFNIQPIKAGFCLCGARVNEDQSFCSACGKKLDWSNEE